MFILCCTYCLGPKYSKRKLSITGMFEVILQVITDFSYSGTSAEILYQSKGRGDPGGGGLAFWGTPKLHKEGEENVARECNAF